MSKARSLDRPEARVLRDFALSLPETYEEFPWGERVAKVNGKVFVFLGMDGDELGLSVKLPQSAVLALGLPFASPTGYGLGRAGWVTARFGKREKAPVDLLRSWIDESYRAVAPKKLVAALAAASAPRKPRRARKARLKPGRPAPGAVAPALHKRRPVIPGTFAMDKRRGRSASACRLPGDPGGSQRPLVH